MALIIFDQLEQGSDDWHDQRRGIVTASVVGKLVTARTLKPAENDESRGLTALLAAERLTGYTDPTFMNSDMFRGVIEEPIARDLYSEHYAPAVECGFVVRDDWGFQIGASPDGLVGEEGGIEIKSRRQKKHLQTILSGQVPAENVAQIQCSLLVTGRAWWDYVSFCSGMPLWVHRVLPDAKWHAAIVDAVAKFELTAESIIADYHALTEGLPATERIDNDLSLVF